MGGVVSGTLGTVVTFWLVASIYNRLMRGTFMAPATDPHPAGQRA